MGVAVEDAVGVRLVLLGYVCGVCYVGQVAGRVLGEVSSVVVDRVGAVYVLVDWITDVSSEESP